MGNLYIVATPIGNMQDITLRAIDTLKKVEVVACEDTRKTGLLLSNILKDSKRPRLISYYEQNELTRIPEIISALKDGLDIALVSDAGTPTVSDPGFKLVRECIKENIKVISIPGPSSVISSLVSSGLPTDKFLFVGFPPHKKGHRIQFFEKLYSVSKMLNTTIIIFEAPHKLTQTLIGIKEAFGDIDVVISRELTKIFEEIRREKTSESLAHFEKTAPKGEFIILLNYKGDHLKT